MTVFSLSKFDVLDDAWLRELQHDELSGSTEKINIILT